MDKNQRSGNKSRRWFLTGGILNSKKEKVKMLTADGRLVEVDRSVLDAAAKQKATNKDILNWMDNPSKNENQNENTKPKS